MEQKIKVRLRVCEILSFIYRCFTLAYYLNIVRILLCRFDNEIVLFVDKYFISP